MNIPIIDLDGALAPSSAGGQKAARQIRSAAEDSGFFYVRNHGIAAEMIAEQFDITARFFALDEKAKDALSLRFSGRGRGYERLGAQTLDAGAKPDLKESFYCGIEYPDDHDYVVKGYHSYGPNLWPEELPEMKASCLRYIAAMRVLALRIMQLLAISLELPEMYFGSAHASPMATLRLLRYPPHPEGADGLTFGAGAHTDWGAVTLLAQDRHGGLEVSAADGSWVPATPIDGTLVVNLGDMIPRWTNGRYRSNPHRVRNVYSGSDSRYSMPFFYNPDFEAEVRPVETCIDPAVGPLYEPCTVGEHLAHMYRTTYGLK